MFEGTDEDVFYALPQIKGKEAHSSVDSKSNSLGCRVIESLSVQSLKFGLFGKIDLFFLETGELVERKNILKKFLQVKYINYGHNVFACKRWDML